MVRKEDSKSGQGPASSSNSALAACLPLSLAAAEQGRQGAFWVLIADGAASPCRRVNPWGPGHGETLLSPGRRCGSCQSWCHP